MEDQESSEHAPDPPPPPNPSSDLEIVPPLRPTSNDETTKSGTFSGQITIFNIPPITALGWLCDDVDGTIKHTKDASPIPHASGSGPRNPQALTLEKVETKSKRPEARESSASKFGMRSNDRIDGVTFKRAYEPYDDIVGENAQPISLQHLALVRKFYSKKASPVPLEEYLLRLHHFCPMSVGVYLATSVYIHKLTVGHNISITRRNVHRLVLAGLRVAMKAVEDYSYPHSRFSKVGGVTALELSRLEISFCYLMNFELQVDARTLTAELVRMTKERCTTRYAGGEKSTESTANILGEEIATSI
ncbi:MAG: hypothetical protein M1834_000593 [Cirrosporium novae-zelandiae]|nr:MAG: hypothetical protein M1834_000593 [Cirrosporium novae-zelandiae]